MSQISISDLYENKQEKLKLTWVAGLAAKNKILSNDRIAQSNQGLIDHLNFIHPNWIQVLSRNEVDYINNLDAQNLNKKLDTLKQSNLACIVVADDAKAPDCMCQLADATHTPLLRSPFPSVEVIWLLRSYLGQVLAPSCCLHGVLLDVLGMGVMITGESGVGKSELALELISRGHGLVADDVVELRRIAPETLEGRCPPILRDYLEVRGLGMLNIRTIFGETAVRRHKNMKLIVHLQNTTSTEAYQLERLPISNLNETIMNVDISKVIIPVAAGRNLAVLVEAAVRNYVLQLRGIDGTKDFIERHEQEMADLPEDRDE
ncbi:HPr(Ser) kinase/phosphatase [Nitrosomonas sp.]|uniref:HPr(Ser) kinase/phosphatase n=1 Tax=Nitrosomonas sp. TaxID=42353 RepID=UPI001DC28186|nr:HPr(Ser) kinase/phosphatase [Nitrosomonas sp.]MCB1949291.1 HPr kinase/phosphorylase [Nitrosomonas sp.]MCP5242308.1 HPr kinase/phosphorylase [Burkholderiales bacterium]MDR4514775.1 HPr(Ser) kinase/phosphatase [Nitrosomonas sp.]